MEGAKVSVVIACFNDADFIEQAVVSVQNQTYSNIEIIVVDDGSDSRTKNVLQSIETSIDLLIFQENKGVSAARNKGIESSSGAYIFILDSDDYIEPTLLEKALSEIQKDKNVRLVSCHANLIYGEKKKGFLKPNGGDIVSFLNNNRALGTSLYKKDDINQLGGYDDKMLLGLEDWEFNIRIMALGGMAKIIQEPLYNYRMRKNSRNEVAIIHKTEIWEYIILKNKNIFQAHFSETLDIFLFRIKKCERQKQKMIKSLEYRSGKILFSPLRLLQKIKQKIN